MTSKKLLGSIPAAEEKSVPVFLRECIAARMPCTAATQDTREKTLKSWHEYVELGQCRGRLHTDDLRACLFCFLASEGRGEAS